MKTFAGDIIILHLVTKNQIHMCMVPEMRSDTDRFFCNFWPVFVLLPTHTHTHPCTPTHTYTHTHTHKNTPKELENQNFEKECLQILSFYTYMCTKSENDMIYGS